MNKGVEMAKTKLKSVGATELEMSAQLPLWADNIRALPKTVAQSALFTVNCNTPRKNYKLKTVASQTGVSIVYTGEELRTDDEDVLLQLLHLARMQVLGQEVTFSSYAMIKSLSWSMNRHSYQRLYESINRMRATNVVIGFTDPGTGKWVEYHDSLIMSANHGGDNSGDKARSKWRVSFHPRVMVLFSEANYSEFEWKIRKSFSAPLAKKLHSLILSLPKNPPGMSIDELHRIMGSDSLGMRQFRSRVRAVLQAFVERHVLDAFVMDSATGLVRWSRSQTPVLGVKT